METLQALEPTMTICPVDYMKNSTPTSLDTLDFPYDFNEVFRNRFEGFSLGHKADAIN